MIYRFAMVARVVLVYKFGGIYLLNFIFLSSIFVFIYLKNSLRKKNVIKLYRVHGPIHMSS